MSRPDALKARRKTPPLGASRTETTAPPALHTIPPATPEGTSPLATLPPFPAPPPKMAPPPFPKPLPALPPPSLPPTDAFDVPVVETQPIPVLPENWLMKPETATIDTLWSALVLLYQKDDMLRLQATRVLLFLCPPDEAMIELLPGAFENPRDFLHAFTTTLLLKHPDAPQIQSPELVKTAIIEQMDDDQTRLAVASLARTMLSEPAIGTALSVLGEVARFSQETLLEWLQHQPREKISEELLQATLREMLSPVLSVDVDVEKLEEVLVAEPLLGGIVDDTRRADAIGGDEGGFTLVVEKDEGRYFDGDFDEVAWIEEEPLDDDEDDGEYSELERGTTGVPVILDQVDYQQMLGLGQAISADAEAPDDTFDMDDASVEISPTTTEYAPASEVSSDSLPSHETQQYYYGYDLNQETQDYKYGYNTDVAKDSQLPPLYASWGDLEQAQTEGPAQEEPDELADELKVEESARRRSASKKKATPARQQAPASKLEEQKADLAREDSAVRTLLAPSQPTPTNLLDSLDTPKTSLPTGVVDFSELDSLVADEPASAADVDDQKAAKGVARSAIIPRPSAAAPVPPPEAAPPPAMGAPLPDIIPAPVTTPMPAKPAAPASARPDLSSRGAPPPMPRPQAPPPRPMAPPPPPPGAMPGAMAPPPPMPPPPEAMASTTLRGGDDAGLIPMQGAPISQDEIDALLGHADDMDDLDLHEAEASADEDFHEAEVEIYPEELEPPAPAKKQAKEAAGPEGKRKDKRTDEADGIAKSGALPVEKERAQSERSEENLTRAGGGGKWQEAIGKLEESKDRDKVQLDRETTTGEYLPVSPEPIGLGQRSTDLFGGEAPSQSREPVSFSMAPERKSSPLAGLKWLVLGPLYIATAPIWGLFWLGQKSWEGTQWLIEKGRDKLEERATSKGIRVFELALADDAAKPGPVERSIAQSRYLMRKLQLAFGLKVVAWLNGIDAVLEMITEYAHKVLKTWQSLKAKGKKFLRQRNRTLHQGQAEDLMLARLQLSRILGLPGYIPEKYIPLVENPELQMKLNDPTFPLEMVLSLRGLLDELKRDVDTLPKLKFDLMTSVSESVKGSFKSTILPLIPNPFAFLASWKDLFVMGMWMHYSRSEIERMYLQFVDHYQTTIKLSLEATALAEAEAGIDLPPETVSAQHLALFDFEFKLLNALAHPREALTQDPEMDVKKAAEATKQSLQRLVQALCFPERIVSLRHRSKLELLQEYQQGSQLYQLHPRVALALEEWLHQEVYRHRHQLEMTNIAATKLLAMHSDNTLEEQKLEEAARQLKEAKWLRKRKQILRKIEDHVGPWS